MLGQITRIDMVSPSTGCTHKTDSTVLQQVGIDTRYGACEQSIHIFEIVSAYLPSRNRYKIYGERR